MTENILYPWKQETIIHHTQRLLLSYKHWTGRCLLDIDGTPQLMAQVLWETPFVVASHGIEENPILNYGNQQALDLWEMTWEQFTHTPSCETAQPLQREDRQLLLTQAKTQGYIDNYRGIRISSKGKQFWISNAIIWNILDENQQQCGQAATFKQWKYI
ncbi:MAG: MEKHLA domain-containing protein [Trichodesmium sp. St16_bin4-tuft]|nr:MEKHLA domain-containing protein [Trichodesmium sp. MAG_R01]MDE5070132.1 MEKHLA domain-containing protein [Trichodesmium sp. St4_bin8_1]MDE5074113.1 MEKHLA domain-containing protein [Trichodesmium sp. St5_bin8]MDE5079024.1 MEKHLA domain-containing protein [Trichodesmium sp. St2_bin6]MDE5090656.1 MEKHLA domain-containing protein [Trichodesmium sp. St18_bin3_1_1]MDE5097964.1 MEKHLA domain-containing protein [Trichodesmium sp. St16_bin4-tuft]MDE5103095.1 MEKHLA domain-containing protein [Tric